MSRTIAAPAVALALVAAASALAAVARAEDPPAPLKFGWPVPSKVTVTEKMLKGGHTATKRFTATLAREGEELRVRFTDFAILEIDGKPSSDPALAKSIEMTQMMLKATPYLVLAADGTVKDVGGLDAAVDVLVDELTKTGDEKQKAAAAALREQLRSPAVAAESKRRAMKDWQTWVGEWIGRSVPEGKGVEGDHSIRCPDGADMKAPTLLKRASAESEGAGLVKLTRESVLDGEDTAEALAAWVKKLSDATGQRPPDGYFTGMRLSDRSLAVTDPATLRPLRVMREEQYTWRMKDRPERTEIERHEFAFEWPAAEPAAKPAEGPK
jgi:hypothetical protein